MAGTQSSGSGSSFPKQRLAIGVVLGVVAVGALFAVFGQAGGSRTPAPAHAEQTSADSANSKSLTDVILSVEGMSCGACAARVKGTLKDIDGVADIEVGLAERTVRVRYAAGKVTPEHLAAVINKLGYKATVPAQAATEKPDAESPAEPSASELQVTTVTIPVDGMACEHCAQSVKERLAGIDGVKDVEIDLSGKKARVRYVEGLTTPERFVKEIDAQGFKAGTPTGEGE